MQLCRGTGWFFFLHAGEAEGNRGIIKLQELVECLFQRFSPVTFWISLQRGFLRNVFFWHFDIISSLCVEYIIWFYQNKAIQLTPHDFNKKKSLRKKMEIHIFFVPVWDKTLGSHPNLVEINADLKEQLFNTHTRVLANLIPLIHGSAEPHKTFYRVCWKSKNLKEPKIFYWELEADCQVRTIESLQLDICWPGFLRNK